MQLDELLTKLKENIQLNVELFNKLEKEYKVSDIRLCEPIIDNSKYLVVLMTVIRNKLSENYHMQLKALNDVCEDLEKIKNLKKYYNKEMNNQLKNRIQNMEIQKKAIELRKEKGKNYTRKELNIMAKPAGIKYFCKFNKHDLAKN